VHYDAYSGRFSFSDPIYRAVASTMLKRTSDLSSDNDLAVVFKTWSAKVSESTFDRDLFRTLIMTISDQHERPSLTTRSHRDGSFE
jgi:hypothetical protein